MEVDNKNLDNNIFGLILTVASIFLAVLGFFVNDNESSILLLLMIALFIISILCILLKQNAIACCVILVMIFVCVYVCFEAESNPPPSVPPVTGTSNQTWEDVEPPVIDSEPPKTKETEPPKPKETDAKIEISYNIYCVDNAGETAKFSISGETARINPQWSSSNTDIVKIDSNGNVIAIGEGNASIYAEIRFDGKTYSEHIDVSIVQETVNKETYRLRYLQSVPEGLNQNHGDYDELWNTYRIYDNEQDALSTIKRSYSTCESGPNVIGYVYYHWCRGSYNDPTIILNDSGRAYPYNCNHNRLSEPKKSVVQAYGESINLDSFSCFFSDKYTNLSVLYAHESGCYWFENPGVCNDSFWFWTVPVYETEYTGYDTQLRIIVND